MSMNGRILLYGKWSMKCQPVVFDMHVTKINAQCALQFILHFCTDPFDYCNSTKDGVYVVLERKKKLRSRSKNDWRIDEPIMDDSAMQHNRNVCNSTVCCMDQYQLAMWGSVIVAAVEWRGVSPPANGTERNGRVRHATYPQ